MTQLIGVILAGGLSLRMGEDKSSMLINGKTMLQHMLSILSKTQLAKVVVNRNATSASKCDEFSQQTNCSAYIQDIIPNKGPLSGIHSALVNFPNDDLLIVPVDMPMLRASSLNQLIAIARKQKLNARFVLSSPNNEEFKTKSATMPLYIQNNSEIRQKLERILLEKSILSVYHFCSLFPIVQVPLENEFELTNLNYPEQLSQMIKDKQ